MNTKLNLKNVVVVGCDIDTKTYLRRDEAAPRGHKDFVMSRSELLGFARCPWKWINGIPNQESEALKFGELVDCAILTPHKFDKMFIARPETYEAKSLVCPSCGSSTEKLVCNKCKCEREEKIDTRKWNENAAECRKWSDAQRKLGLEPVRFEVMNDVKRAVAMFNQDERLAELVACSRKQMMIVATYIDSATGIEVPLKCLLDIVPDSSHPRFSKSLADLKSARSADLRSWEKAIAEHGYDVQAAFFTDIYCAAHPNEERLDWRFAIIENEPPFVTGRRILSESFMELGRCKYRAALRDYCVCLATGVWPSYDDVGNNTMNGWSFAEPRDWMVAESFGLGLKLPALEKSNGPDVELSGERIDFLN